MANLEEGIVQHWSWDRIVLVGDACHKFTPNQGLGYNNGIQDVVALVNELHRSMAAHHSGGGSLSREALTSVFARYQSTRMELLQKDYKASAKYTRMSAWRNWMLWFLDRYIFPSIPGFDDFVLTRVVAGLISKSPVLDFVESEEPFQGKVPWKHAMKSPSVKSAA
jgi:2-polyprenyl-6-methoxyphenol hydroxylase-like FAD-dependent oxidoreductase